MSVINEMLRELDRRGAAAPAGPMTSQVRPVGHASGGHEWLWRVVAVVLLIAIAWAGWVMVQLRPRPLATDSAFIAAENAKLHPAQPAAPPAPEKPAPQLAPAETKLPVADASPVAGDGAQPAPRVLEVLKLAQSIDTPIVQPTPDQPPAQKKARSETRNAAAAGSPPVVKRDLPAATGDAAEAAFRRGVALMNQSRLTDAEASFSAALGIDPGHVGSRQALVALLLERRQIDAAQRLLEEGLVLYPGEVQFATVLARILVERGDLARALSVLESTPQGAKSVEHQTMLGAVLQRLGRHAEAVQAFENASRIGVASAATLVAMGVSYERLGQKSDAVRAYERSLTAQASDEVRGYAQNRIRALR